MRDDATFELPAFQPQAEEKKTKEVYACVVAAGTVASISCYRHNMSKSVKAQKEQVDDVQYCHQDFLMTLRNSGLQMCNAQLSLDVLKGGQPYCKL